MQAHLARQQQPDTAVGKRGRLAKIKYLRIWLTVECVCMYCPPCGTNCNVFTGGPLSKIMNIYHGPDHILSPKTTLDSLYIESEDTGTMNPTYLACPFVTVHPISNLMPLQNSNYLGMASSRPLNLFLVNPLGNKKLEWRIWPWNIQPRLQVSQVPLELD
jgi:hypothetical protein